jgi:hypothetical protein
LPLLLALWMPVKAQVQSGHQPVTASTSTSDTPFVQETHTAFPVGKEKDDNEVRSIAVDQKQTVWIATAGGIFRKPAGSSVWTPVITGEDGGPAYAVSLQSDGTILLGTWNGL